MKILVVYQSSTCFTEKCANWIGNELACKVITFRELTHEMITFL